MSDANRPKDMKNEEHSFNLNRRTKSSDDKRSGSQRDEDKAEEADRGATRKR